MRSMQEMLQNGERSERGLAEAMPPAVTEEGRRLGAKVMKMNARPAVRLKTIAEFADRVGQLAAPFVACRPGCDNCCHIQVPLDEVEARAIGQRIGVEPAIPRKTIYSSKHDFGRHTPCTFLVNGVCSIYEDRPLVCRIHVNMDIDSDACDLDGRGQVYTGDLNGQKPHIVQAAKDVIAAAGSKTKADIRAYFPHGRTGT